MRCLLPALLALLALPLAPARGAESYDNCTGFVDSIPAVISTQGTWCLRGDLSSALETGAAINVQTNNVTLDCNHFKLGGLAAGTDTIAHGVVAVNRLNLTLRNCTIRGFYRGAFVDGGAGHLIEHNRFEGNVLAGVSMYADGSIIRHNQVVDTGQSSVYPASTAGLVATGSDNQVLDNSISGVDPLSSGGTAYGIYVSASGAAAIGRNTISGLDPETAGSVYGIYAESCSPIIYENILNGVGDNPSSTGVRCTNSQGSARANVIAKFSTGVSQCYASGNVVNPN